MWSQATAQAYINTARGTSMPAWSPFLGLFVGDPFAGGAEVVGGSYARQAVTLGAPSGYIATNTNLITFPTPSASWGILTHMVLMESGGTVHESYLLGGTDADRTVGVGTTPIVIAIGTLIYTGQP